MDYSLHIDKKYLEDLILKLKDGQIGENNKIDLKSEWYKLDQEEGQAEFAKDVCAIANTFGLEGCIIIGLKESGETFDAPVISSGIKDVNNIYQVLVKHTNPAPSIEIDVIKIGECNISIVKIPPSLDKPHFVKKHKTRLNAIFVRSGTSTKLANRSDIDLMYYDRKNIEPEYNAIIEIFSKDSFNFYPAKDHDRKPVLQINVKAFIQNIGRRPIAFKECSLVFEKNDSPEGSLSFLFNLKKYLLNSHEFPCRGNVLIEPIILKSNDVTFISFDFEVRPNIVQTIESMEGYFKSGSFSALLKLLSVREEQFKSNEFKYTNI